jgi:hypothetical protein
MWKTLSFTLPVLFPSWQFFKTVEPSPRVQWALLSGSETSAVEWREFRSPPLTMSLFQMVLRLFWNPHWNDALFVVSCAERIQQSPDPHSINEIRRRVLSDLQKLPIDTAGKLLQFRLIFVHRGDAGLVHEVVFLSDTSPATVSAGC